MVFAGLGFGLQFVFEKVLEIDTVEASPVTVSDNNGSSYTAGQKVDIVIEDQELPEDESDSQFFVGTNHQMLNESDYGENAEKPVQSEAYNAVKTAKSFDENGMSSKAEEKRENQAGKVEENPVKVQIASENSSSAGFVPINLGETPKNLTGTESKSPEIVNSSSQNTDKTVSSGSSSFVSEESKADELDVLPDLEDIAFNANKASSETNVFEDGESSPSESAPSGQVDASKITEGKDAEVMAKAISTLLAKEK